MKRLINRTQFWDLSIEILEIYCLTLLLCYIRQYKPNTVVSADSVNVFKNRLGKFWEKQKFKFDWNADITGIGNRSVIN